MDDLEYYYEHDTNDPDSFETKEKTYTEDDTINMKATKWG
jgi:hypothetical protein